MVLVRVIICFFTGLHAVTVTLAMIGKLGAAAAFAVIYIFSAELYPTVVRNAGMGASSCCARVGGILAPYVADMVWQNTKTIFYF
jgi:OCT family organic cation transporter-like MFS transporter 4/5